MPQMPNIDISALATEVCSLIEHSNTPIESAKAAELASMVRDRIEALQKQTYVRFMVLAYDLVDRLCGFAPDQLMEEHDTPRRAILSKNLSMLMELFHGYRHPSKPSRAGSRRA